jgi:signal peptidase II
MRTKAICQQAVTSRLSSMRRLILFVTLPLYILDVATKSWIVKNFELHVDERVVIPNFFWLHHTANTGIAFGMFNGTEYANWAFGAVSLAALALFTWFYRKGLFPGALSRFALSLLLAGIFGNLTDRLMHGYVVDFLKFDLHVRFANPWPSFNVADSCVVVAAILLAIASFFETPAPAKSDH